jgi:hypothetical protein
MSFAKVGAPSDLGKTRFLGTGPGGYPQRCATKKVRGSTAGGSGDSWPNRRLWGWQSLTRRIAAELEAVEALLATQRLAASDLDALMPSLLDRVYWGERGRRLSRMSDTTRERSEAVGGVEALF